MCGFVGVVTPRTAARLAHRGPDARGAAGALLLPWASVSLEMARLAVVGRSPLAVPLDFRASCGVVLAYNGEVYNWRALRDEISDGTTWETECDAEVVARAWRRWGPAMLDRMNGMWGIALVDVLRGEVFLARDRAGEKPLYYARCGEGVAFASEIKALPVRLEEVACPDVDVFEFDCQEETPFRGVRRLGPGQLLHLKGGDDLRVLAPRTWWQLGVDVDGDMPFARVVDELEALVVDAVRIRIPDEVSFGVQVSGGLDSAIVQAVARAERIYTVSFVEDGESVLPLARLAAGRQPTVVSFEMRDLVEVLRNVAYHLDTPATWTAVCQWFLCRQMAADGCVVALSGEGADELFGGYSRYRLLYWLERAQTDARLAAYRYARERLHGTNEDLIARMLDRSPSGAARARALAIVRRYATGKGLLVDAMRVDFYTTMQVLLRMADAMAAASSMENRSVFFDYRILDLAARTPVCHKVTESESKAVLCAVARRLGVAEEVVDQTTKRGLYVPWAKWTASDGWDRSGFAVIMRGAWREAFELANEQPVDVAACAVP